MRADTVPLSTQTSDKAWAAPDLSDAPAASTSSPFFAMMSPHSSGSVRDSAALVKRWMMNGTRSTPSASTTCASAVAAARRTSGCASPTAFVSSSGWNSGRCGARACSWAVPAHNAARLPQTSAARRFVSAARSRSPRARMGANNAKAGASGARANSRCSRASNACNVQCAGSHKAASNSLRAARTSGFDATEKTSSSAFRAASLTPSCVSAKASARAGTAFGSTAPSCFGAQLAVAPSISIAATRARHDVVSSPAACLSTSGSASLTPWAERPPKTSRAAFFAAFRTTSLESAKQFNSGASNLIS
mmetsp:Transcript_22651/g.63877  ORF Transcript_22651/g.63877 Transcript_22651/m.63877 type:complete len:306 (+) Transcript_22651:1327-2244(+)